LFESSVQRISNNEGFNIWGRNPKQLCIQMADTNKDIYKKYSGFTV